MQKSLSDIKRNSGVNEPLIFITFNNWWAKPRDFKTVYSLFEVIDSHFQWIPMLGQHNVFSLEAETITRCYLASRKNFLSWIAVKKCHTEWLPTCPVKKGNQQQDIPASDGPREFFPLSSENMVYEKWLGKAAQYLYHFNYVQFS